MSKVEENLFTEYDWNFYSIEM